VVLVVVLRATITTLLHRELTDQELGFLAKDLEVDIKGTHTIQVAVVELEVLAPMVTTDLMVV
jgi:hypothetical protein